VTHDWGEFVFAPPTARTGETITLSDEEAHHLFRVRRVAVGQQVYVTDGEGFVHVCTASADHQLQVIESRRDYNEPAHPLTLLCGVLKGDSNRTVVDDATQLGAVEIHFFQAMRSEGRLSEEKIERLNRVARTAIKQCGRARLPRIVIHPNLEAALRALTEPCLIFLAHPSEPAQNRAELPTGAMAIVVGPEGGLTDTEVTLAFEHGCRALALGRRRLRAETAVSVGLSYLLTRLGECAAG
jgi:16S rRNA (uracil1498-N3)-methyltransferase